MSHRLRIILTLLLLVYLAVATVMALSRDGDSAVCRGVEIVVDGQGPSQAHPFVTPQELGRELDSLPAHARGRLMSSIDLQQVKDKLMALDKIEDVSVVAYTDGRIVIKARPIVPVMRVFDSGRSYYVNRAGKRVTASAHYRADVPVVMGRFDPSDTVMTPVKLLPLLDLLAADPVWSSFFAMVRVDSPTDVVLIPVVCGQEVNIGDLSDLADKLARLRRFYTEVLPVKGWDAYNSLSLKWKGQLVARRNGPVETTDSLMAVDDDEAVDAGTMLAGDDVAPGQALPGRKANNEKPIPAVKSEAKAKDKDKPTEGKEEKKDEPKAKPQGSQPRQDKKTEKTA